MGLLSSEHPPVRASAIALAFVALTILLAPATASADHDGDGGLLLFIVGTTAVGAIDLAFLTTDLVYGVQGELLPAPAAWAQLFLASVGTYAMGVVTLLITTKPFGTALGIAELGLGTWFAWHSIRSLDPPREPRPRPIALSIVPRPGGTSVILTHSF